MTIRKKGGSVYGFPLRHVARALVAVPLHAFDPFGIEYAGAEDETAFLIGRANARLRGLRKIVLRPLFLLNLSFQTPGI
jgi:hypothetical protein